MLTDFVSTPHLFTIGHSNHSFDRFLELLKAHSIEVIADTRSYPYSNYSPQFDRERLRQSLTDAGLKYVDLGKELGGRPEGNDFYDSGGHVLYDRLAVAPHFQQGLVRLENGYRKYALALLCSEENPAVCHRALLISRVLHERGVGIDHIRGDGRIQPHADLAAASTPDPPQANLFPDSEASTWKSIPSVSRKKRRESSLNS